MTRWLTGQLARGASARAGDFEADKVAEGQPVVADHLAKRAVLGDGLLHRRPDRTWGGPQAGSRADRLLGVVIEDVDHPCSRAINPGGIPVARA